MNLNELEIVDGKIKMYVSIPVEHAEELLDCICERFGYRETIEKYNEAGDIEMVPNPQTKLDFSAEMTKSILEGIMFKMQRKRVEREMTRPSLR